MFDIFHNFKKCWSINSWTREWKKKTVANKKFQQFLKDGKWSDECNSKCLEMQVEELPHRRQQPAQQGQEQQRWQRAVEGLELKRLINVYTQNNWSPHRVPHLQIQKVLNPGIAPRQITGDIFYKKWAKDMSREN